MQTLEYHRPAERLCELSMLLARCFHDSTSQTGRLQQPRLQRRRWRCSTHCPADAKSGHFHSALLCLRLRFCLHTLNVVQKTRKSLLNNSLGQSVFFVFIANHAFNHDGSMLTIMEVSSAAAAEGSRATTLVQTETTMAQARRTLLLTMLP